MKSNTDRFQSSSILQDAVALIEATGYKVNLDYLDGGVRKILSHDPLCSRIPLLLTRGSILAQLPTIGFVGFYEGPYWGVMEMQARFVARMWGKHNTVPGYLPDSELYQHYVTERVRHAMRYEYSLQIPQFWMSDYVGLVEELAREAGVTRDDSVFDGQQGPAFPSRYQGPGTDQEAAMVVREVADAIEAASSSARFVAAAVFRAMQGVWVMNRKIKSHNAASTGGVLTGTAHFHPRSPTDPQYSSEYLYIEEGTFTMETGFTFPATRRYIYRYSDVTDKITAWFTGDDGTSVGSLFNTWDFQPSDDESRGWVAKGHHWCDPDTYRNTCEFRFKGASLQTFAITYQVEGPSKDYSHESWYERPTQSTK